MFSKAVLTYLAIGALSVNALSIPVAREPTPEPESQELEARIIPFLPAIAAGVAGTALGSLFSKPKREVGSEDLEARGHIGFSPSPFSVHHGKRDEELDARVLPIPALAAGLMGIAAGAPLIPLFQKPKREVGSEDLEARHWSLGTLVGELIHGKPKRDLGGEHQDLEARIIPFLPAIAAGVAGTALGSLFSKPKRDVGAENQELDARLNPLILPGLSVVGALAPLFFPSKPKRELSDELFSREPETFQELEARIGLPAITTGLGALAALTPLIPSFVNRPKREASMFGSSWGPARASGL